MSEIKKDAIAWESGEAEAKTKSSWNDFTSESNFYKPVKGDTIHLRNAGFKKSTTAQFPVFEVYKSKAANAQFLGYLSFRKVQALKYREILLSREEKPYAKFDVQNTWGAPEGTTYGAESLRKELEGKTITITDAVDQKIPKFGVDLSQRVIEMVADTYYPMILKA